MPEEVKTFSGSLVLDLRIWWRHVHTLYGDLTWKLLVFWKTGGWGEVATTRGSTVYCYVTLGLQANQQPTITLTKG